MQKRLGQKFGEKYMKKSVVSKVSKDFEIETKDNSIDNSLSFYYKKISKYPVLSTEEEKELVRRGRNLPLTIAKRHNPKVHTSATAFEVLIGYLYINDKKRLEDIFEIISKKAL